MGHTFRLGPAVQGVAPKGALITPEYLEQIRLLRTAEYMPGWGNSGQRHVKPIEKLLRASLASDNRDEKLKSLLDYGCGHGHILKQLTFNGIAMRVALQGYDPGMPEYSALPEPADLLISTDVLEHIEPDCLDDVLAHMKSLTLKKAYLNISCRPARISLPDGKNAHLIVEEPDWWHTRLSAYFSDIQTLRIDERRHNVTYLATP